MDELLKRSIIDKVLGGLGRDAGARTIVFPLAIIQKIFQEENKIGWSEVDIIMISKSLLGFYRSLIINLLTYHVDIS